MRPVSWEQLFRDIDFSPSFRLAVEAQLPVDFWSRVGRELGDFLPSHPGFDIYKLYYEDEVGYALLLLSGREMGFRGWVAWRDKAGGVIRHDEDVRDRELELWWQWIEDAIHEDAPFSSPAWAAEFGFPITMIEHMPDSNMSLDVTFGEVPSGEELSRLQRCAQDVFDGWRGPGAIRSPGTVAAQVDRRVALEMDFHCAGTGGLRALLRVLAEAFSIESIRIS